MAAPLPTPTRWKGLDSSTSPCASAYLSSSFSLSATQSIVNNGLLRASVFLGLGQSRPHGIRLPRVVEGQHLAAIVSLHQRLEQNRRRVTRVEEVMYDDEAAAGHVERNVPQHHIGHLGDPVRASEVLLAA
eukprot:CAMPEP_0173273060 /NCGR_PEP_ID=MMETSP1143-20121109/1698_1 /TAXON_ID=483371 /ORGANISM="non described non described, Strain CCMP2298" /LENGTH=130 /DNA_ID=CAMNT_0014209765 /DNA_START=818 /DNA_END=1206 /DNA_ORIENTATION=+